MNANPVIDRSTKIRVTLRFTYIALLAAGLMGLLGTVLFAHLSSPSIPNLGLSSQQRAAELISSWAKGTVIVLIRHAERCDHSDAPCLDDPDGITRRGRDQATAMGKAFDELGVERADIFTSPLTRTKQTATYMFKSVAVEKEWLSTCETISFDDVSRSKTAGRNLILVTHSHCIERLERTLNIATFKETAYGSLMFILFDENARRAMAAELIAAEQFVDDFT